MITDERIATLALRELVRRERVPADTEATLARLAAEFGAQVADDYLAGVLARCTGR